MRVALADQDDAGPTDDPVHEVLVLGDGDGRSARFQPRLSMPQRRGRGAGLALELGVRRPLGPPAEDDHRGEQADETPTIDDRRSGAGRYQNRPPSDQPDDQEPRRAGSGRS